ncbi:MAG: hypothetical protein MHPSP_002014, partial [Paramarteilia canceri]
MKEAFDGLFDTHTEIHRSDHIDSSLAVTAASFTEVDIASKIEDMIESLIIQMKRNMETKKLAKDWNIFSKSQVQTVISFIEELNLSSESTAVYEKSLKVDDLFRQVTISLKIWEVDYFGLKLINEGSQNDRFSISWLDSNLPIGTYSKSSRSNYSSLTCELSIKHYLTDPCIISDENTRYFYFAQIFSDINQKKCDVLVELEAYIFALVLQSQFGDGFLHSNIDPFPDKNNFNQKIDYEYAKSIEFLPHQSDQLIKAAAKIHQT